MESVSVIAAIRTDYLKAGKMPVVIRILVKRKVAKTIPTGITIEPSQWDESIRLVKGSPNADLFNTKIKREVARLEGLITAKQLMGVPMTKMRVKQIVEGKDPSKQFSAFCQS